MSAKRKAQGKNRRLNLGAARAMAEVSAIARKSPAHRRVLRSALAKLLALGDRVAASLRQNAARRLHQAASLAVIGTLAIFTLACDEAPADATGGVPDDEIALVQAQELQAEVANGLPAAADKSYQVKDGSVSRDDRGVYYLDWLDPQTNEYKSASVSRLKLQVAPDNSTTLRMSTQGDPVLSLAADTPIALVWPADDLTPTADATVTVTVSPTTTPTGYASSSYNNHYYPSYYGGGYHSSDWFPFFVAGTMMNSGGTRVIDSSASVASYRDPAVGQALVPNQPLTGNVASQSPRPFVDRTISRTTVSGMNKGTGGGYAVTGKTGPSVSKSSFSSGTSGSSVTSGRTGAATGKSSSGVSAPKSGGFSTGKGSSSSGSSS